MRKYLFLIFMLIYSFASFADTIYLPYNTRNKTELDAMLTADGAGAFAASFNQKYVYKIRIVSESGVDFIIDKILMYLGVTPDYVIGYGYNNNNSDVSLVSIGTTPSGMFDFNTSAWVNLTAYCGAPDIYAKVETDWITHTPSTMTLWMGCNSSLGSSFHFDTIEGSIDRSRVWIDGYVISEDIVNVPISYTPVDQTTLSALLTADGAGAHSGSFDFPYVYKITMTSYAGECTAVSILMHLGQSASKAIGWSNGHHFMPVEIGHDETDMYEFESSTWEEITSYCDDPDIYVSMLEDIYTHERANLSLWFGYSSSLGPEISYEILEYFNGPHTFSIQGYQVSDVNSVPITYNTITKSNLDNLLTADGAGSFTSEFTQNYVYRFYISSHSGYDAGFVKILMHLGQTATKVIGYGEGGSYSDMVKIGTEESDLYNLNYNVWEDLTTYCNAPDLYARVDVDWITHLSSRMTLWIEFSSSLGSSILYDIMDGFEGPASFIIQGYQISTEVTMATLNLAYIPVTRTEIDTLFLEDNAADFLNNFDYKYLYRFDLTSQINLTKGNKIVIHMNTAPEKVIAYSNGTTRQLATIGKELTNQILFGTNAWVDVTSYADAMDLYVVMVDDPTEHYPGHLILWLGTDHSLGQSIVYETVDNASPPATFNIRSYRKTFRSVENIRIISPPEYKLAWLQEGDQYYFDRDYYIVNIPDSLRDLVWVKTANDDKNSTADSLLKVFLEWEANVYVGYDHRGAILPAWLTDNFESTYLSIEVLDQASPLTIWRRSVPGGLFSMGGNKAGEADGAKSSYIVLIDMPEKIPPVADFDFTPRQGNLPLTVEFFDHSTGDIDCRHWDFGDGETGTGQSPVHTYNSAGIFYVDLCVIGPAGSDSKTDSVVVTENAPVADFKADTTLGVVPLTVQFTDLSTGVITDWQWDFGDSQFSSEQNPAHTYSWADTFTVSLTVTGPGGSDTKTKSNYITVNEQPPVAHFAADTTFGKIPFTVHFADSSTGIINKWEWNFGDGQTGSEQNPVHTYTKADTFSVSLTVTGPGGSDTKTRDNYILVLEIPPSANFGADTTFGEIPFTVHFADSSTGVINKWEWDFGDGQTGTEQNPVHTYDKADTCTVSLTVTGPGGKDTKTRTNYIIAVLPSGINDEWAGIPTEFQLRQNYPNPFNPQTKITFGLPKTAHITITVYNLKGEQIETLFSGKKAAGFHHITWNAVNHSSGTYFIKMKAENFVKVNKCVLLK
ncbi:PKD domain-containing protein [candidate division KSB1 bacterium]|nr:PKD domain-containing protein [candidate division KSB1 bacterium]